ncbi:unnamed protein product [Symbiodinium natans]|uniref:Uncharacterized protein n=1 Tax=Symbiodinium natans TaxID=878477 RepID=A0A812T251_9DINO|nr:unnamed protein product [Symbiodinium natans]
MAVLVLVHATPTAVPVISRVEQAISKIDVGSLDVQKITSDILNGKVDLTGLAKEIDLGPPTKTEAPKIDIVE